MRKDSILFLVICFLMVACAGHTTPTSPSLTPLFTVPGNSPTLVASSSGGTSAAPVVSGTGVGLPIGIHSSPDYLAYFDATLGVDDFIASGLPNLESLANIHQAHKVWVFSNPNTLQGVSNDIFTQVDYIGLDLEPGGQNRSRDEILSTVQQSAEIARQHQVKLLIAPTARYSEVYGPEIAPYADIIVMQMMTYQGNPQDFAVKVQSFGSAIRTANPNIRLFVQVGTQRDQTPQQLAAAVQAAAPYLDGIWIQWHYRPAGSGVKSGGPNIDEVKELIGLLRGANP